MFCRSLYVLFLLAIVLSDLLRITASAFLHIKYLTIDLEPKRGNDISMISDSREVEKGGCDHPVQVNQYINEL